MTKKKKKKSSKKSKLLEASRKRLEDKSKTPLAVYSCLNCGNVYMDKPAPTTCPNPECPNIDGPDHPGCKDDRGVYVKWLNYEDFEA